ncbi:DUF4296 domain-containing protein [uncultured Dokdonia sp.]|uniref:DUF4296 domain-containing protein n=1 Tax=uncultured Dokdonia sp. TaxID=575653 RepID=UPI00260E5884|nr:DUF4296 domain-containing protein [uncultured Dokdonia sp.]
MKQFAYIFFIFLVISCQDIPSVEKPTDLIDRAKMEEIIYEMAVVNGARGYDIQKLSKYGVAPETYIFEKYAIDSLQLAKSITYYASDIEDYKDMYVTIQKRAEAEFKGYDSLAKIEKKVKDSLRTEKAKQLQRERDSIKKLDSLKGKVSDKIEKTRSPIRVSKEIFIDSL